MIQDNSSPTEWPSDSPGGVLAVATDVQRAEAGMNQSAAFQHFGLRARITAAAQVVELPRILPHHRGGTTVHSVNGAVVAMMCDAALGLTLIATGLPVPPGSGVARLDIRMKKPIEGDSARAIARITAVRRNLVYAGITVEDERGIVCVVATGTVYRGRR